jgi:hypothetical protein
MAGRAGVTLADGSVKRCWYRKCIVARDTIHLVADNCNNLGGRIQGNSVLINAKNRHQ